MATPDACNVTASTRCINFCPRTGLDMDEASQAALGVAYSGKPIGDYQQIFIARSNDPKVLKRAQYGGAVSVLTGLALRLGVINKAVLTRTVNGVPRGVVASSWEEVLECGSSNYLVSPTVAAFNRIPASNGAADARIGVVGTPCQIQALSKMRASPLAGRSNAPRLALTIGLFCTWALGHSFRTMLAKVAPPEQVKRTDVPPPPARIFVVQTDQGKVELPLDEVRQHIPLACQLCADMTAELADISVGAAEGIEGWNTLVVRTKRGAELVQAAFDQGLLKRGELPNESLEHLKGASLGKRRRAVTNIAAKSGSQDNLLYLRLRPELTRRWQGS
ncbi:MAG: Coenzyme F420 hydrogenase/dehydrogenase, beta subunit C-terminal domain [Chloroflexi bacterium]|nr:Coenzyme F420 hydrogenase/dehydrogenase, beta subunit C-terminal domain [Chloroflexota bacterium]